MMFSFTLTQWFALLIDNTLKSVVILAVACCAAWIVRERSAAARHVAWLVAMASLLLLPACSLLFPTWGVKLTKPAVTLVAESSRLISRAARGTGMVIQAASRSSIVTPVQLTFVIWLLGVCGAVLVMMTGMIRVGLLTHQASPVREGRWTVGMDRAVRQFGLTRPVRLLQCRAVAAPLTWGIVRPSILLPMDSDNWTETRINVVLLHELAHIARYDWLTQFAVEMTRAIYWFNPLVWAVCRRLRFESERACDDAVLNRGTEGTEYASELLAVARLLKNPGAAWLPALPMVRHSNLERRFAAMLNPSLDRRETSVRRVVLAALLAVSILLPVAALPFPAQVLLVPGQLLGTVYDALGKQVPNATVIAQNIDTGGREMTTTDISGDFAFSALPAGHYSIEVLSTDFAGLKIREISVEPNQTVPLNAMVIHQMDSTASALPSTVKRVRIGGDVLRSHVIEQVRPRYPEAAKTARVQGVVLMEGVIGADGLPQSLRIVNPETNPDLARAAVEAVNKWRFSPTVVDGVSAEVVTMITVNFAFKD